MGAKTISPCSSEVWSDWGVNSYYSCPELIHYEMKLNKYISFNPGQVLRLWDNEAKISLDNPVMTSLITETIMYDDSPESLAKFNTVWGLQESSSFKDMFDIYRYMTE